MAEYLINNDTLTGLANKIRALNGIEDTMTLAEMQSELESFNNNMNTVITEQDAIIEQITESLSAVSTRITNLEAEIAELEESWAGNLTFTGPYALSSTYCTASGCSIAVDKQKGMAFITVQGGTSYYNLSFIPSNLPSGVTMLPIPDGKGATGGSPQRYFTAVFTGITGKIDVKINMISSSTCHTSITYV